MTKATKVLGIVLLLTFISIGIFVFAIGEGQRENVSEVVLIRDYLDHNLGKRIFVFQVNTDGTLNGSQPRYMLPINIDEATKNAKLREFVGKLIERIQQSENRTENELPAERCWDKRTQTWVRC